MESLRSAHREERHRLNEMKEGKIETRHADVIHGANGPRFSAPLAVYPYQRIRDGSLTEDDERRLSIIRRPVVTRISSTPASSRKVFKTYTISEILKTNENPPERETYDDSGNSRHISIDRHCFSPSRESFVREHCWCYDDGVNSQQCTTCCQCYPAYRYSYTMPYRTWQIASDRDPLQCGFSSTGIFIRIFHSSFRY